MTTLSMDRRAAQLSSVQRYSVWCVHIIDETPDDDNTTVSRLLISGERGVVMTRGAEEICAKPQEFPQNAEKNRPTRRRSAVFLRDLTTPVPRSRATSSNKREENATPLVCILRARCARG